MEYTHAGTPGAIPRARLRDHHALLAFTIGAPLLEAVPLRYFHVTAGLAPQLTALTPFAVFHDLRWLLVFHNSWTAFTLELAAFLAARTAFHASVVFAAWPRDEPRPPARDLVTVAFVFTAVCAVVISPAAALAFAGGATSLSWLQLAGLPLFLLVAIAVSHGGVDARWWWRLPTARSTGWILLTFVALNLSAAAVLLGPWWIAWLSAGLAGLYNAWSWQCLVAHLARRECGRTVRAPRALLLVIGIFVLAIAVSTWQLRVFGRPGHAVRKIDATAGSGDVPVLAASGFDSSWDGHAPTTTAAPPRLVVTRFSYAGLDAHDRPRPYQPQDTHASLGHLLTVMDAQVHAIATRTGAPVRLLATSEGSLLARSYVQVFPNAPVSDLVMVSPLVEPGRVYYPPGGAEGWGVAARAEMHALGVMIGAISGVDVNPDMPFLRSVVDHAPALRRGLLCPAPHARVVAFLPTASDVSVPPLGDGPRVPVRVVSGFHGVGLAQALQYLASGRMPSAPAGLHTLNRLLRAGATAWMVPELPTALNPAWHAPVFDKRHCPITGWPAPTQ